MSAFLVMFLGCVFSVFESFSLVLCFVLSRLCRFSYFLKIWSLHKLLWCFVGF